jgi:hypothetical protein
MISKSLKDALADAKAAPAAGTSGGSKHWETGDYPVVVVNTNVTQNDNSKAFRLGLQVQRESDGRRIWLDMYFDENNAKAMHMTMLKIDALGLSELADSVSDVYPIDPAAPVAAQEAAYKLQLEALAAAMVDLHFVAEITKNENRNNAADATDDPTDGKPDKKYINWFSVKAVSSPAATATPVAGLGGLNGLMG